MFFLETSIVFYKKKEAGISTSLKICYIIMLLSFAYMLDLSLGPANADWDRLALGTIGERLLVCLKDGNKGGL